MKDPGGPPRIGTRGQYPSHYPTMKRRHFLKRSALASAPLILPASVLGKGGAIAPSERIGLALIGCGGQGSSAFASA